MGAALQALQPRLQRPLVVVGGGQQDARADQLQLEARRGGAAHLGEPGVDEVGGPAELGGAERRRLRLHPLDDLRGPVDEPLLRGVRHGGEDHEVPQPLQQVGDEPPRVAAALDDLVDDLEGRRAVARGERLDDGVEQRAVGVPRREVAMAYVTPSSPAPARSWSMTDMESRTDPAPARTTSGSTPSSTGMSSCPHTWATGTPAACRAGRAGTGSGGSATGWCR